jgi:DNA-binding transcriptional LysR family regulator
MFDWQDMRTFATLAQSGSLAATARALGVSHATVGRRIAALESALGVRLVDRLPRHTPLTETGVAIAALAADMYATAERIERRARDTSATLTGMVTISAPPVLASDVIAPALAALRKRHPRLSITLLAQAGVASLDRGEADIAVRLVPPDRPRHIVRSLGAVSFGLYATASVAASPPPTWCFVAYDATLAHIPHHRWLETMAGDRPIVFRSSDVHAQVAAVRQGIGVAALPRFVADVDPALVEIGCDPIPSRTIWLVIHADLRRAPAVRAAADHLIATFEAHPGF